MKEKNLETAKRLREALLASGLSQQELSDRSGVAKASISQYVNGTHAPGNTKAGQMAEVLGCDPLWLMGFDVPQTKEEEVTRETKFHDMVSTLSDAEWEELENYIDFMKSKRKPS